MGGEGAPNRKRPEGVPGRFCEVTLEALPSKMYLPNISFGDYIAALPALKFMATCTSGWTVDSVSLMKRRP